MKNQDINIFVLVNRIRHYTIASIESYIRSLPHFTITLSYNGNSEREIDTLRRVVREKNAKLIVNTTSSFFDHFDYLRTLNSKDFAMFLHDDDLLLSGAGDLILGLEKNIDYSYALSDSLQIGDIRKTTTSFLQKKQRLLTPFEVLLPYLFNRHLVAFPALIYNAKTLRMLEVDNYKFGKYSDVEIVAHMAEQGIVQVNPADFVYQIHNDQDSSSVDYEMKQAVRHFLIAKLKAGFRFSSLKKLVFVALTVFKKRESLMAPSSIGNFGIKNDT